MSAYNVMEALDEAYVKKDIYRDTQLRLDKGVENMEECIIQLSKITQNLCVKVRRLEDILTREIDFFDEERGRY